MDRFSSNASGRRNSRTVVFAPIRLVRAEQARRHNLHSRHRGAVADPGPLIRRKSSILERNSLRTGEVLALL
jgi:hypothetical protein